MSKCAVHVDCYSDVQTELENYKLTSQLYAQLEHSDVGSSILGSRKVEEECKRQASELSRGIWIKCHKSGVQEQSYLPYLVSL